MARRELYDRLGSRENVVVLVKDQLFDDSEVRTTHVQGEGWRIRLFALDFAPRP